MVQSGIKASGTYAESWICALTCERFVKPAMPCNRNLKKKPKEISAKDLLIFLVLLKFRFLFAGFGLILMMFHANIS